MGDGGPDAEGGATDPIAGLTGYVPGWTDQGHPGYLGYAWYRIRVRLEAPPGREAGPRRTRDLDDAYQVFDNGELLGHFGDFNGKAARPRITPSPKCFR